MKSESGFTIIEVMIAAAVLCIALLATLDVLQGTMKATQVYNDSDQASAAATAILGQIQTYAFGDYNDTYTQFNGKSYGASTAPLLTGLQSASATVSVDNSNPNLLQATVTVTWTDLTGAQTTSQETTITQSQ